MEYTFTDQNFASDVLSSPTPVLVDFWAAWCGPCRAMAPVIEEIAASADPSKLKIGKLNVDENGDTAMKYRVMSIPTFLVFQNGQVVDQFVGGMTKEAFMGKIGKYLA